MSRISSRSTPRKLSGGAPREVRSESREFSDEPPSAYTWVLDGQTTILVEALTDGGDYEDFFDASGALIASGSEGESEDFSWVEVTKVRGDEVRPPHGPYARARPRRVPPRRAGGHAGLKSPSRPRPSRRRPQRLLPRRRSSWRRSTSIRSSPGSDARPRAPDRHRRSERATGSRALRSEPRARAARSSPRCAPLDGAPDAELAPGTRTRRQARQSEALAPERRRLPRADGGRASGRRRPRRGEALRAEDRQDRDRHLARCRSSPRVLKHYAAKDEALSGPRRSGFSSDTLRDFRRNGLDLDDERAGAPPRAQRSAHQARTRLRLEPGERPPHDRGDARRARRPAEGVARVHIHPGTRTGRSSSRPITPITFPSSRTPKTARLLSICTSNSKIEPRTRTSR